MYEVWGPHKCLLFQCIVVVLVFSSFSICFSFIIVSSYVSPNHAMQFSCLLYHCSLSCCCCNVNGMWAHVIYLFFQYIVVVLVFPSSFCMMSLPLMCLCMDLQIILCHFHDCCITVLCFLVVIICMEYGHFLLMHPSCSFFVFLPFICDASSILVPSSISPNCVIPFS